MELRSLQYFVAMYEEGSVSRAARRLNIVQPAMSHQLANLEDELGHPLFQRTPKGLIPTNAEHEAYRLFLPILRSVEAARQELSASRNTAQGHVAVGVVASVAYDALSESWRCSARSIRVSRYGLRTAIPANCSKCSAPGNSISWSSMRRRSVTNISRLI